MMKVAVRDGFAVVVGGSDDGVLVVVVVRDDDVSCDEVPVEFVADGEVASFVVADADKVAVAAD